MESLTFSQMLELIAALHDVPPSRESALKARLQNLQRLKFPAGINTGRGKPATYDAPALVKIILAFELMQFGLQPERTTKMIAGLASGWLAIQAASAGYEIARDAQSHGENDQFLLFDPTALALLSDPSDDGALALRSASSSDRMELAASIGLLDSDAIDRLEGLHRRFAAINLTKLLRHAAHHLNEQTDIPIGAFALALMKWGKDNEWSPPDDVD